MKRILALCLSALMLTAALAPPAFAAEVCYPVSITRSDDGSEIRKVYDLGPNEDPAGIPRSDFEQEGFHYTLIDLLKQEVPEYEERPHTETVSLDSKSKDMESVLALLPQEREFVTEDGLSGVLKLQLSTVRVDVSGYGSSTKEVTTTRSYPNLASQDTSNIPKTIEDGGKTLTLQNISWQTDNTASVDSYAMGDRFTAVATYSGSATSSYVKGYTVTTRFTLHPSNIQSFPPKTFNTFPEIGKVYLMLLTGLLPSCHVSLGCSWTSAIRVSMSLRLSAASITSNSLSKAPNIL